MRQSKGLLVCGSVIGAFLVVYGTAFVFRLFMGDYLLAGGLLDVNYAYLALLTALPFVALGIVGSPKTSFKMFFASGVLFAVLFIVVHWAFVFTGEQASGKEIGRMLMVFPISALLVVVATCVFLTRSGTDALFHR